MKEGKDSVTPQESAKIKKDHQESVRQWRKRKRMVRMIVVTSTSLSLSLSHTHTHTHTHTQSTDIVNAILEGYPKSKKEFFVSGVTLFHLLTYNPFLQEEVGIETDEDYGVTLPKQ